MDKYKVLLVDDEQFNLNLLQAVLKNDYDLMEAKNGEEAIKAAEEFKPDLILLDIMMPEMDGYEVCKVLKSKESTVNIPVIFITALDDVSNEEIGFEIGGVDYITKPISPKIVQVRIKNHILIAERHQSCFNQVKERTHSLKETQRAAVFMLGEAGHYNDNDTGVHIWRMADYCVAIARAFGWHRKDQSLLELAAPMHDTGKIGIDDAILKKPTRLDEKEWEIMKTHTIIGNNILSKSDAPLFKMAANIALHHHERWDGAGYPHGLSGIGIPESARIVAIADVFDALTMKRPYKDPWSVERSIEEIKSMSGFYFDPKLVELFLSIMPEILDIKASWDSKEELTNQVS